MEPGGTEGSRTLEVHMCLHVVRLWVCELPEASGMEPGRAKGSRTLEVHMWVHEVRFVGVLATGCP